MDADIRVTVVMVFVLAFVRGSLPTRGARRGI